ncbi:putative MFS family arabinose efflux permease [Halopolyspora algeriensis]|uniref:Putative MFS family arabinose efflux permease n=2 Tax=Halopolyspora algeriensis TaxID=1500506 RepID=A0A368VT30_9ACTN|nr:putative MFS family arabinose efflux permease [Halopolyspora algeriensis]TQM47598.1 putative MFS family arabinose efflux permease [Halopolyspora algeriensis]
MAAYTSGRSETDRNGGQVTSAQPSISDTSARSGSAERTDTGGMFRSLRERNYRYYASGQIVSLTGTWMQRAAQDWLVLELSGGSPAALGFAVALQFMPTLLLTLWAGLIADRFDKRRLLIVVQTAMGLCGLALGLLDVTGVVELWHVYALAMVLGAFSAIDAPVRQSFVVEMVGPAQLTNAVALNSMTFNLARIVGPAIAGVLITMIGTGPVFVSNGASSAAVVLGLVLMDPARLRRPTAAPKEGGQLRAGLRYVRGRAELMVILALVFCVSTFGMNFESVFAVIARNVFHRDAAGYGLLITMLAVGTLSGAALAARRSGSGRPRLRLLFAGAAAFGALEAFASQLPSYEIFAMALVPVGVAVMTFTTTANSTVQLSIDPAMRGRVMGLYMMLFLGGRPIGGLLSGWLAEVLGGRAPLLLGGLATLVATAAGAAVLAWRRREVADDSRLG